MRGPLVFIVFILLPAVGCMFLAIEYRQYGGAITMMSFALLAAYACGFSNGFDYRDRQP